MANYEHLTAVPLDLPARETFNQKKLAFIVDDVFSKEVSLKYRKYTRLLLNLWRVNL